MPRAVRHEHRVAQLLPGVGDGLHAHFHGHHTNHPAVVVHEGRQTGRARPWSCPRRKSARCHRPVHRESRGGCGSSGAQSCSACPSCLMQGEALRVHHIQHVGARVLVHGLKVGVGGVAHLLGCGVVQQLAHQRVLGGGEGQIVVVRGHPRSARACTSPERRRLSHCASRSFWAAHSPAATTSSAARHSRAAMNPAPRRSRSKRCEGRGAPAPAESAGATRGSTVSRRVCRLRRVKESAKNSSGGGPRCAL